MHATNVLTPNPRPKQHLWVSAILIAAVAPLVIVSFPVIVSGASASSPAGLFGIALAWFILLGVAFLEYTGVRSLAWCAAPILLTMRALLELGIVPGIRVATGDDMLDGLYARAMLLVLLGFIAFWIGSLILYREQRFSFRALCSDTRYRTVSACVFCFLVGTLAKVFMWKAGLSSYLADDVSRTSAAAVLQWLGLAAAMLQASLVISSIELFGKVSTSITIRFLFVASFFLCLVFGFISGMKEEIFAPILQVVLVYGITRGRLPKIAWALPLLLVLLYPFMNAYRANLNRGYRYQVGSVHGLSAVMQQSLNDALTGHIVGQPNQSGMKSSSERLSLLSSVRFLMGLPVPSLLEGDEKLWMAPFYPFVPRAIWHNKPVIDKGRRFSIALGTSSNTSTAVTPIGDLFILGGYGGVICGMFVYGLCLQGFMRWIGGSFSEKTVFLFLSILLHLINLEADVFSLITEALLYTFIYLVIARFIYGGRLFGLRPLYVSREAAASS